MLPGHVCGSLCRTAVKPPAKGLAGPGREAALARRAQASCVREARPERTLCCRLVAAGVRRSAGQGRAVSGAGLPGALVPWGPVRKLPSRQLAFTIRSTTRQTRTQSRPLSGSGLGALTVMCGQGFSWSHLAGTLFQRQVPQPLCLSYRGETDAPSLPDAGDCQGSVDRDSGRPGRGVLPGPWGFPEDAQHSRAPAPVCPCMLFRGTGTGTAPVIWKGVSGCCAGGHMLQGCRECLSCCRLPPPGEFCQASVEELRQGRIWPCSAGRFFKEIRVIFQELFQDACIMPVFAGTQ